MEEAARRVREQAGHATMADVARAAGVSLKSVSRVINDEPHVSVRLRTKVECAIAELDYVPDFAARSLAGARSFVVGLLFDNPSPNYIMKVQAGAYRTCIARGYHLRVDTIDSARGDLRGQLDAVVRHGRIDAFVLSPPLTDNAQVLDYLEHRGLIYTRIAPVLDIGRSPSVHIDDSAAAAEVAQYLWNLGHRRFGIVNGPAEHGAAGARRAGFLERIRALDPDAAVLEQHGGFQFAGGIAAGQGLLGGQCRPTAIFATNDDMAAGVMVAIAEAGLKVPQDISVIGFDDSWVAMSVWPYLTTVHQPIEEMAETAVRIALDRVRGETGDPGETQRWLSYAIVERASAGPCT